jgi:hypothetical protein
MKTKLTSALILALTLSLVVTIIPAMAYFGSVTFSGQGFVTGGTGLTGLQTEICGLSNDAEVNGPYLLWTLNAPGARNADISGPWGTDTMTHSGSGTFRYVSGWYDLDGLTAHPVKAVYDGKPQTGRLVVSYGCAPSR